MTTRQFKEQDLGAAQFINVNLYKAEFDDVNMAEAVIHNANLANARIYDANIQGMTIYGIRVDILIEQEFDRRDPMRVQLRMQDVHDTAEVQRVMRVLNSTRDRFTETLRAQSPDILNSHPGPQRWSALEHLRHLVFAEDLYLNRWILRNDKSWIKLGFLPPFLYGNPAYAAVGTAPTQNLEQVVAVWQKLHAELLAWIEQAQQIDLHRDTSQIAFGQQTIGDVLQTLASHDLQHIRMAETAITDSLS
ncbi:MAG: DinB family protein [Anaerolineae bacterium]|nr:DinB family protein [Anaerolineae bacterium]